MATMVFPVSEFSVDKAKKWIADADTVELVDMLCFRLVRNVEGAEQLAFSLAGEEPTRYAGLRLLMNLLVVRKLADVEKPKASHRNGRKAVMPLRALQGKSRKKSSGAFN